MAKLMANLTNSGKLINKIESLEPIEYHAGEGISIGDISINGRKGPSPDGFHVPSMAEWQGLKTIMDSLSLTTGGGWRINLHMPFAGSRYYSDASLLNQGSYGYYWSSSPYSASSNYARYLRLHSSYVDADSGYGRADGDSVRCFKDSYVEPTSSWTVIQGTLGSAGIFWNQSEGLISITDGSTGYTIMDKNLGATAVYNDGDTLTEANMGYMYQWGNNYGFPSTGTITNTSSTQVDASAYGPTNPYSSDTFITGSYNWSSVANDDLWGDTTGTITQENVISNTGVLSVNGQTGDVTISVPTKVSDLTNDSNFQTDTQVSQSIATAVASAYKYKGSVANQAALPASGNTAGDVYNTEDTGMNYAWTGSAWDPLGATVDLSNYLAKNNTTAFTPTGDYNPATKLYVDGKAAAISGISTTQPSNPVVGSTYYDTTNKMLKVYNGTSWEIVGPELKSVTQAEYDAMSAAEKNNGKYYLITDNDGTVIAGGIPTTQPTTPSQGNMYYDTTNNTVKIYNGTSWVDVGGNSNDINVKGFVISSTSDTTNAQAAVDWYVAGKTPIVIYNNKEYVLSNRTLSTYIFQTVDNSIMNTMYTTISADQLNIYHTNDVVSGIATSTFDKKYLDPEALTYGEGGDYIDSFTPTSPCQPATKKYVDDQVGNIETLLAAI